MRRRKNWSTEGLRVKPESYQPATSNIHVYLQKLPADFGVDVYRKSGDDLVLGISAAKGLQPLEGVSRCV